MKLDKSVPLVKADREWEFDQCTESLMSLLRSRAVLLNWLLLVKLFGG